MARIDKPTYTMLPNVLIESMGEMTESEFRIVVAVARKTFGWQKERDLISLSQLIELTGMSKQGVCNGIEKAIENGWLARVSQGQSFVYELLVNEVDQVLVNEVDRLSKKLVNEVDTQKKEELKEKSAPKKGARPEEALKERTRQALERGLARHEGLTALIEHEFNLSPNWDNKDWRALIQWLKERPAGETIDRFARWWYANDWRGKEGAPPTSRLIRELWPQAFQNGNRPHALSYREVTG